MVNFLTGTRAEKLSLLKLKSSAWLRLSRSGTFQIVIDCLPPSFTSADEAAIIPPSETLRILNGRGYAFIGGPQTLWESLNWTHELMIMEERASLLTMQKLALTGRKNDLPGKPLDDLITYYLAVVQRL